MPGESQALPDLVGAPLTAQPHPPQRVLQIRTVAMGPPRS